MITVQFNCNLQHDHVYYEKDSFHEIENSLYDSIKEYCKPVIVASTQRKEETTSAPEIAPVPQEQAVGTEEVTVQDETPPVEVVPENQPETVLPSSTEPATIENAEVSTQEKSLEEIMSDLDNKA